MDIGYNNSADNIWLSDDSFATWGPLCQHGLSLMPALIGNYIHYKVWDEITYPFPNINGTTVEVWE